MKHQFLSTSKGQISKPLKASTLRISSVYIYRFFLGVFIGGCVVFISPYLFAQEDDISSIVEELDLIPRASTPRVESEQSREADSDEPQIEATDPVLETSPIEELETKSNGPEQLTARPIPGGSNIEPPQTNNIGGIAIPITPFQTRDFSISPWHLENTKILDRIQSLEESSGGTETEEIKKLKTSFKARLIREFFTDLTQVAYYEESQRMLHRDSFLSDIMSALSSESNPYFMVTGGAGEGKSMIPLELSRLIMEGKVPSRLRGRRVLQLDLEKLARENQKLPKELVKPDILNRLIELSKELVEYQNDIVIAIDITNPNMQKNHLDKVLTEISKNRNIPIVLMGRDRDKAFVENGVQLVIQTGEPPRLSRNEVIDVVIQTLTPTMESTNVTMSRSAINDLVIVIERSGNPRDIGFIIEVARRSINRRYQDRIQGTPERIRVLENKIRRLNLELTALQEEDGPLADRERRMIEEDIAGRRKEIEAIRNWMSEYQELFENLVQMDDYIVSQTSELTRLERQRQTLEVDLAPMWALLRQSLQTYLSPYGDLNAQKFINDVIERSYRLGQGDIRKAEEEILDLANRYLTGPQYQQPNENGQSIIQELVEMTSLQVSAILGKAFSSDNSTNHRALTNSIKTIEEYIQTTRDNIVNIHAQLESALGENFPDDLSQEIGRSELLNSLASQTNRSPESLMALFETPEARLSRLASELRSRYVGQEHFVEAILEMERNGRNSHKGPVYSAFLLGGSTKGKSELPKIIGETLYGEDCTFDFPIGQAKSSSDINTYLGSPDGYSGGEGRLYEALQKCSEGVMNFDEIDKVDPSILQSFFYPMLRSGITENKRGKRLDFRNFRIFMSANSLEKLLQMFPDLAEEIDGIIQSGDEESTDYDTRNRALLFKALHGDDAQSQTNALRQMLEEEDGNQYPQAFLRRINYLGYANNFNDNDYQNLIRAIFAHDIGKALKEFLRIEVELTPSAVERLAQLSINRTRDAADVAPTLVNHVINPIKKWRELTDENSEAINRNDIIQFDFEGDSFVAYKLDANSNKISESPIGKRISPEPQYWTASFFAPRCEVIFEGLNLAE